MENSHPVMPEEPRAASSATLGGMPFGSNPDPSSATAVDRLNLPSGSRRLPSRGFPWEEEDSSRLS